MSARILVVDDVEANVRGRVRALCERFPIYQG